jgi:hypothetical protein
MKPILTIPNNYVPFVRKGLFGELGYANERLANLSLQFEGDMPDGSYSTLLHTFFTIFVTLFELGHRQGDVTINLSIGGSYVVKGLKQERLALEDQLSEMPRRTRKAMRDAAAAKVAEFGEFVQEVEEQVRRLNRQPVKSPTSHSIPPPPLRRG